jgi:hypothetical protein
MTEKLHAAVDAAVRELSFAHHMDRFRSVILKHVEPVFKEVANAQSHAQAVPGDPGEVRDRPAPPGLDPAV